MRQLFLAFLACLFIIPMSAQNTGIGETAPSARLEVKGNGNSNTTSNLYLKNSSNQLLFRVNNAGAVGIGIDPGSTSGLLIGGLTPNVYLYNANGIIGGGFTPTDSSLQIFSKAGFGSPFCSPPCPAGDLIFQPPTGALYSFRGRVGFFTNTPTTDLQIAGKVMVGGGDPGTGYQLSVNGKMICTEARVQLAASWPDYVFRKDYKLRTIPQLEQFIKKNNHLPGIPSAKIMEEGHDLGETQRKIMEKVEELSLYIIQLHKRNEQLAAELKEVKQQLTKKR